MLRKHDNLRIRVDHIGTRRAPVVVIDDFLSEPERLVDWAAQCSFRVTSRYYPGIRSPAPDAYRNALRAALSEVVREVFGWKDDLDVTESNFSLVTTPATRLIPFQRLPHFDGTDSNELAVLHYLCRPEQGGTSFYRHRATGCEVVDTTTVEGYVQAVNAEVRASGLPPAQYVDGDTALFERIARYEAVFNRALIYRGTSLHSGNVPRGFVPDADPRTGRLTINTFLRPLSPVPH